MNSFWLISIQVLLCKALSSATDSLFHRPSTRRRNKLQSYDTSLTPQKPAGDDSCPCLSFDDLYGGGNHRLINLTYIPDDVLSFLGPAVDKSTYGLGCAPHDALSPVCSNNGCSHIVPLPIDCENYWCGRSWCFVDADNCGVVHEPSVYFEGLHFSYATCGHIDSFTLAERRKAVEGKTYRVAYNANTGGWKGAYNPEGSFAIDSQWRGPIVDFVQFAAMLGKFTVNVTRPPEWLYKESQGFFGNSFFNYCIYATSLGYLDFCVSAYTITDKRAASATFFETTAIPLYLISFTDSSGTSWDVFAKELVAVFRPFTWEVWVLIMFFVLPVLGMLMLVHEYDAPGSAYPHTVPVLGVRKESGTREKKEIREKHVPMFKHTIASIYMGLLSFLQNSYGHSVVTVGGKINLLAISSFVLMVSAVYTANLAAILTQDYQKPAVSDLASAINGGYKICMDREVSEIIRSLYDIDPNQIVPDPVEIGGDGLPGFNCPKCLSRNRVFDFMSQHKQKGDDSLYCDVAVASMEDLEVFQGYGDHCNKTRVGDVLAHNSVGIPIYSGVSQELISLFYEMKNNGYMNNAVNKAYPESTCPEEEGEGTALTLGQMTGIWVITAMFALVGMFTKFIKDKLCTKRPGRERQLQRYDQWGHPTGYYVLLDGQKLDIPDYSNEINEETTHSEAGKYDSIKYGCSSIQNNAKRSNRDFSICIEKQRDEGWYMPYEKTSQRGRSLEIFLDEAVPICLHSHESKSIAVFHDDGDRNKVYCDRVKAKSLKIPSNRRRRSLGSLWKGKRGDEGSFENNATRSLTLSKLFRRRSLDIFGNDKDQDEEHNENTTTNAERGK